MVFKNVPQYSNFQKNVLCICQCLKKEAVLVNRLQKIAKSVSFPSHAICLAKMALSLDNKALLLYHFVLKQTQQTVTPEQSPLQIKKHCIDVFNVRRAAILFKDWNFTIFESFWFYFC